MKDKLNILLHLIDATAFLGLTRQHVMPFACLDIDTQYLFMVSAKITQYQEPN